MSAAKLPVAVIEPWKPGIWPRFKEVWRFRALLPYLGKEFILKRYRKTFLSWIWIPLRPGIHIGSQALLFGGFLGVASGDRPYFIFIAFGQAAWMLFDGALRWGTRSVRMGRGITGGLHFPRSSLLASTAAPALLDFLLYSLVAFIGVGYYMISHGKSYLAPPQQMLVALAGLGLLILFGQAISLFTAPLAMITKEARYAVAYLTQFWFFVTPVIYPISQLPKKYQPIAEYNPITAPIEWVKYGLLDTAPPQTNSIIVFAITITVLLLGGLWFASRFEHAAVDRL